MEVKLWSLLLLSSLALAQQNEAPPTQKDEYQAPNLNRGLGTVPEQTPGDAAANQRRYPDRNSEYGSAPKQDYDPGSAFRQADTGVQKYTSFAYDNSQPGAGRDYPTFNKSNPARQPGTPATLAPSVLAATTTTLPPAAGGATPKASRDPFQDPNRYRGPQQQEVQDGVRFVNGRPYKEPPNVQDRYGNRYDPRFHSIPGQYDPENDPRFSDPRFEDPRNLPKFNNNRQRIPLDRYDSKYRYYERFPDRQRDRLRDPNYDPRYDPLDPPVPGVLGGWLPELQGECRPGCENLPRDVTINTNYGRVNGFLVYLYDGPRVQEYDRPGVANVDRVKTTVSVFLGIPFAQAPIGEARLMPPRPHRGWQSYDAVDWAPVCPQPIRFVGATKNAPLMDEDCLYLNIYTPTVKSGQPQQFPVMFYIHGGEFNHGSGNEFPGHQLAAWGKLVVVTINYRLGALGFLSTGDHHAPGNYGLLDMAMALKWVYDNIHSFQGDRERITVFGPDAGAASAGLLAVMPRSRNMVRRVIAISGSPLAEWAAFNDKFRAMNNSLVYGERVGCTIDNSWKLVDCVRRGRSFSELTNIEFKPEIGTWPWAPVVQKNISVPENSWYVEWTSADFVALPELVSVLYDNQQYNPKLQYLTGVARDDASYLLYRNKTIAPDYDIGWDFFDMMVRDHIMQYNYTLNPQGIFDAIKYMYTYYPDPNNRSHIREEFVNFWSDVHFKAPQDAMVKLLVRNRVDTYMYVQNTTVEALRLPWWRHITHNLEHFFLSGAPFMDPVFFPEGQQVSRHLWTESDRNMSEFFIYAFSNFSWYGNPTPKNILGVHWDMTKQDEVIKYLALNKTENSTTQWNYRQRECAFWTDYVPSVVSYITPTYPPTTEFWWEPNAPLQIAFWSMSSVSLLLLVMVVICCLLWRNAKRQAKDRYWDGTESHGGGDFDSQHLVPSGEIHAMEKLPHTTSVIDQNNVDLTSMHLINGSILNTLPPQTPIINGNGMHGGSTTTTLPMGSTMPLGYPQYPLPPTPKMINPIHLSHPNVQSMHNVSDDSLPSALSLQVSMMDPRGQQQNQRLIPQQLQPSPGVVRKQYPAESSGTDWSEGGPPPPPPPMPMGLPKSQGKLVPGRMSSSNTQLSGPNNMSATKKDVPSTAV